MYNTEPLKIIPGGLNLIAPGDAVPDGDCLDLTGWAPEAVGKLQQGPGYVIKSNGYGHAVDTILDADGRWYMAGAGSLSRFGTGVLGTGWGTDPIGAISYRGWAWFTSANHQKRDNGTTYTDWAVETPGSAPTEAHAGSGNLLDGDYEYYVTFQTADSFESNPSAQLAVTLSAGDINDITITRPNQVGTEITYWNVYRHGPGLAAPYKVNLSPIAYATATFHDDGSVGNSLDNESLIARDEVMESDHDAPPAARVIANQIYNGRIVVANASAYPNRVWYSKALQPTAFPGSSNPQSGNWVDIGTDAGDQIYAITIHPGRAIVYRRRSVWQIVGDFEDPSSRIEPLVPDVGTVGFRSVVSTSAGDYFASNDGVYRLADWPTKLSTKVETVFVGTAGSIPRTYRKNTALGFNEGRLWVSYTRGIFTYNDATLIYHIATERWSARLGGAMCFQRTSEYFLAGGGTFGEALASLEDGYSESGSGVACSYQSAYVDAGLPDREKTWGDLVITHLTGGANLTVTVYANKTQGAYDYFTLTVLTSSTPTRQVIPLVYPNSYSVVALRGEPIRSFNISIGLAGSGTTGQLVIETPIFLHYRVEARKGKSFDTGPTDHGIPDVKTLDEIEVDIDAPLGASLLVQSDLPGGVLQNQDSYAIAATSGRQVVRIVCTPRDGKLFRHRITGTADFHVYGFRARVLPIGVYLDGTVGDLWDSEAIPIGA